MGLFGKTHKVDIIDVACYEYATLRYMLKGMTFSYAYNILFSSEYEIGFGNGEDDSFICQFGILLCRVYRDSDRKIYDSEGIIEEDGCRLDRLVDIYDRNVKGGYYRSGFDIVKEIESNYSDGCLLDVDKEFEKNSGTSLIELL